MEEFKVALSSDNTESGQGGVRASHLVLALLNLSRGDTYADSFQCETLDNALRLLFDLGERDNREDCRNASRGAAPRPRPLHAHAKPRVAYTTSPLLGLAF